MGSEIVAETPYIGDGRRSKCGCGIDSDDSGYVAPLPPASGNAEPNLRRRKGRFRYDFGNTHTVPPRMRSSQALRRHVLLGAQVGSPKCACSRSRRRVALCDEFKRQRSGESSLIRGYVSRLPNLNNPEARPDLSQLRLLIAGGNVQER